MQRSFVALIAVAMVLVTFSGTAEARRRQHSYASPTCSHMVYTPTAYSTENRFFNRTLSLQDIAQQRADAMAARNSMTHSIHTFTSAPPWPGEVSEGIGCARTSDPQRCSTCITGSRVVADAWSWSATGMVYRVRFFR